MDNELVAAHALYALGWIASVLLVLVTYWHAVHFIMDRWIGRYDHIEELCDELTKFLDCHATNTQPPVGIWIGGAPVEPEIPTEGPPLALDETTRTVQVSELVYAILEKSASGSDVTPNEILNDVIQHIPLKHFFEAAKNIQARKQTT